MWVATVNNRFYEVYQGLHSLSSKEMPDVAHRDQFRVAVIDAVKAEMSIWQNIYNSLTNEYGVGTSPYVASPNEENPWRIQLNTKSDVKWLDLPIRNLESFSVSTGDGSKRLFQTEYNRCADFIKRVQEKVNVAIKQAAEEKSKAVAAASLLAEMSESEKFPLLSVQPKPQVLMKNIHSGATKKWIDAWLVANKIEHNEDSEFLGERLEDLIIKASFRNDNGDVVRQIDFGFRDNVLLNLTINLDGTAATSLDDVVEKYSHDLGPSVNIERKEGEAVVRIMTDDICVCAGDDSFVGRKFAVGKRLAKGALSKIGKNIAALNQSVGNNDQRIADINQGISNIGEGIDNKITKIKIWDRKLSDYMTDKMQKAKEAEAKAAEAARKAKAAAALDF